MYEGLRRDAIVGLMNLVALGLIVWRLRDPRASAVRIEPPPSPTPVSTATPTLAQVYVSGAVRRPGVVKLTGDARLADAVAAAGGMTAEAAPGVINLAARVQDGQHVHVPTAAESDAASLTAGHAVTGPAEGVVGLSAAGGGFDGTALPLGGAGSGTRLLGVPVAEAALGQGAGQASAAGDGRIAINRATAAELERLPGVGPALAGRIVAYREAHGPFRSPQDLLAVSGIGEKTLARFVDQIIVP